MHGEKTKEKFKITPFGVVLFIILALYAASVIYIYVWAFLNSFKTSGDFYYDMFGFPKKWVLEHYVNAFKYLKVPVSLSTGGSYDVLLGEMFAYSVLYSVGAAFFSTLVPCIAAYAAARYKYRFSKVIYTAVIVTMALPIVGNLPSEIQMAKTLGIYDSIPGLWLMKANFLGLYFLVFFAAFKNMPAAYAEAAKVDGAGNFSIMINVALPLIRTTFTTILLLKFIEHWNDYLTPMVYLPGFPTAAYGLYKLQNMTTGEMSFTPAKLAGCMLVLLPILVVFLIFHNRLLGNITMGGIKE